MIHVTELLKLKIRKDKFYRVKISRIFPSDYYHFIVATKKIYKIGKFMDVFHYLNILSIAGYHLNIIQDGLTRDEKEWIRGIEGIVLRETINDKT